MKSFPQLKALRHCHHTWARPVPVPGSSSSSTPAAAAAPWVTAAGPPRSDSGTRSFSSTRGDRDSYGRGDRGRDSRDNSRGRGGRGGGAGGRAGRGWDPAQQDRQQQQQAPRYSQQPPRYSQQQQDDEYSWQGDADDADYYDDGFQYAARPSKASIMDALEGDALYGVAPVLAALTAGIRRPYALLMQEGMTTSARKDARALSEIQRLVAAAGAQVRSVSKHDLNMLAGNRPHQGLILDASPLIWRDMEQLPHVDDLPQQQAGAGVADEQEPGSSGSGSASSARRLLHPVWLALDEVMDPQNLGAMLRSAYCLGVSGVLACSRNCAPLSPVVSKASAGAMELMTLHSCKSMPRTLAAAVNSGWAVVGAAAEADAVPLSELQIGRPTVLVMGNEGYGVRPLVKRLCTQLVQIEMATGGVAAAGAESAADRRQRLQLVDSLNVSVATGILLHHMVAAAKQ